MRSVFILCYTGALLFAGALPSPSKQGITGTVFLVGGNRMPSPGRRQADSAKGTRAVVCVFELTNSRQTDRPDSGPWFSAIHTRLIKQSETDENGRFTIYLPPGNYSLFIKIGDLFYARRFDAQNNVFPVEVLPGKITRVKCPVESARKVFY